MVADALGGITRANAGNGQPGNLTAASCGCVSVFSTAAFTYRVNNQCDAMDVYVHFRATTTALAESGLPISQWVYAGNFASASRDVRIPTSWTVVSLDGFEVKNPTSNIMCPSK
jgi:hypothetical protein